MMPWLLLCALLIGLAATLINSGLFDDVVAPPGPTQPPRVSLAWLNRGLARAGLAHLPPHWLLLITLGAGLGSALIIQLLIGLPLATLAALPGGPFALWAYLSWRYHAQQRLRHEAIVEAVLTMERALATNTTVIGGLEILATSGPEPLQAEFQRVVGEVNRAGMPLMIALRGLRRRLADPVADDFVDALMQAVERGGSGLARSLESLADQALADQAIRREAEALQAGNQFGALIVIGGTIALFVILRRLNPEYMRFYDEWYGQVVAAGGATGLFLAYKWMLAIGRLPSEPRLTGSHDDL